MSTDWKQLLEKRRDILAERHKIDAFKANPNGYSVFPGCNEPDVDFDLGHASLEPLLLRAIEALEYIISSEPTNVSGKFDPINQPQFLNAHKTLAEIKEELELNEKEYSHE